MKTFSQLTAFLWNTLLVYVAFFICRFVFYVVNFNNYETIDSHHLVNLFSAGLLFDTSAILYTNCIFLLLFLIPLPWKETKSYYRIIRWLYVVINSICLSTNLIDCIYFQFTGKRTTISVLNEFSNEGAGAMTKIFAEQFIVNWYLVLLAVLLWIALWKFFRSPLQFKGLATKELLHHKLQLWKYVSINLLAMGLLVPLSIAGMRGGFTASTRPITISNANEFAKQPSETSIILNTPFSIIRTFNKKPFVTPDYMPEAEAKALFTPVHMPADSASFKPMNVVVIILESFSKQHFGFYNQTLRNGTYAGFTPFLDSLIINGAKTYQYSYANGRKSIEGMPSTLSSLPNFVEPLFLTPASLNSMSGLARELSENKGYTSAFFHGAQNSSMGFHAFANATGFQKYYGRTEYNQDPNYNGDEDFDGTWAIWDEEFLQFYCDRMSEMKQPFMTAIFTATSHTPYKLPQRYKGVFPTSEEPMQECIAYTDNALRNFFESAKQQPWFNNTIFVITADHTSVAIDPFYRTSLGRYCVPIILYAPNDPDLHGYDTESVVEQIDIMPTVLNYLNYDKPYIAFGKDMLQTPPANSHALHWVVESNEYEYIKGNYSLLFDGERITHAYRYRTDSLLQHDVLNIMPSDTLLQMEREMKSFIQQYMKRMNDNELVIKK